MVCIEVTVTWVGEITSFYELELVVRACNIYLGAMEGKGKRVRDRQQCLTVVGEEERRSVRAG